MKPLPSRKIIRLQGRDYAAPGAYFVTVVTHKRSRILSRVVDGQSILSEVGEICTQEWFRSAELRANIRLYRNEFVVMPDHLHGIIWIVDENGELPTLYSRADRAEPATTGYGPGSLTTVMGLYKSEVTKRVRAYNQDPLFRVWHRSFHERIIRDEKHLQNVRGYISRNPMAWRYSQD